MSTHKEDFSVYPQKLSFILIFKRKYFQTQTCKQNIWDLLNDGWNLLTYAIFTDRKAIFVVYWWKELSPTWEI